ncbi:TPA: hypothetical protein I8Y21_005348 [Klebsiella oxytoca]|uniref:Uncharacterized protein n=1 Tax=Klebsiella oxytoca TaxID=571 RepID=A0AAN5LD57_KLEOX|nr:hypothetical protein [Klebsiella oxytoca]
MRNRKRINTRYKYKARNAAPDDAVHQAKALATRFNVTPGPLYSVRYHASNCQPGSMVHMMKADAVQISAQETCGLPTIQFDNQVDIVFQI